VTCGGGISGGGEGPSEALSAICPGVGRARSFAGFAEVFAKGSACWRRNPPSLKRLCDLQLWSSCTISLLVSMVLDVQLCCFAGVMGCVMCVSIRRVCVVSGCLMVTRLMMPGGFAMVLCRVLVVLRCFDVVLCCLFGHGRPL